MSEHLGKVTYSDTPDVNGSDVLTTSSLTGTANQITQTGGVLALAPNPVVPGTSGLVLPTGTTAQRPGSPTLGQTRYNSTLAEPEIYSNGNWLPYARVIQSVSGTLASGASASTYTPANTAPASNVGLLLFTQSFTPLVAGSNVVVQYVLSAQAGTTAARNIYTAVYAGTTCIGMGAGSCPASGYGNIAVQAVYVTPSTAAITFTGRCGNLSSNASTSYNTGATVNFGGALITEYRILEII